MTLLLWALLTTVALIAAGLAAGSVLPVRRAAGLLVATAAVAGLLLLLGFDLPAVIWLGLGGVMALLAIATGQGDAPDAPGRSLLLVGTVTTGLLFAVLYRSALQVDWRPLPPEPVAGQTALVGGALLTSDLALLVAVTLLLAVALAIRCRGDHQRRSP